VSSPFTTTLQLPDGFIRAADILALGGELKSSICLIRHGRIQISEAIGDLEEESVYRHFSAQVDTVFQEQRPEHLVIDKHPDYLSAQWGIQLADKYSIGISSIQHHHAHIAAVMADHGLPLNTKPVLGMALDGLGFGEDGSIWGGELLLADYQHYQRLACFQPVAMIGGTAAIREPWRNTMAQLLPIWEEVQQSFADTDIIRFLSNKPVNTMQTMIERNLNSPLASSCGRLFDAVAAALDLYREQVACEAQAAIELERLASSCFKQVTEPYAYNIDRGACLQLNWQPMWLEILADIQHAIPAANIASRFHHTLIHALTELALSLRVTHDFNTVALSGGVLQNRLLATYLPQQLQTHGLKVLLHKQVPTHDGGLSLGQAVIAATHVTKCHESPRQSLT